MQLRALDLVVRHHPSLPPALSGVSLDVSAGEVVAIVGANGSGKSTLARALVGLAQLDAGRITGDGARAPRVGLLLQDPAAQLVAVTVADEVAAGPEGAGAAPGVVAGVVAHELELHGLAALRARHPGGLSGGQQQRVAIAAVAACEVDVIVLDEPTAMLDPVARRALCAGVRDLADGRGVVWITQEAEELAWCDRVVALDAGVVVWQGTRAEYVAQPAVAATLGLELPAVARVALALREAGAWPAVEPIPTTARELVESLAGGDPHA